MSDTETALNAPVPDAAAGAGPGPSVPPGPGSPADQLFGQLYNDLHQLARSRLRQSGELTLLDTTALVHESFLRLRQAAPPAFPDRHHFLAYAARAMRSVVVDLVRSKAAGRHGGELTRVTWRTGVADTEDRHADEVLRVNEALDDLAQAEPRLAMVVELRYFGGLTETETAAVLGLTLRTVQRDWAKARLFLSLALQ